MIELKELSDLMVIPERVTPAGIKLAEQKLLTIVHNNGLSPNQAEALYFSF